jgi:hypothetical protein
MSYFRSLILAPIYLHEKKDDITDQNNLLQYVIREPICMGI